MWDCSRTETSSKNAPVCCKEPYVTMSASVTPSELIGRLFDHRDTANNANNGFGNRFLYLWTKRDKLVPLPQPTPALDAMMDQVAGNILKVYRS